MNQDDEHLRLLELFHYILAGLAGIFALFPVLHLAMGLFFIFSANHQPEAVLVPSQLFGLFFVVVASVFIVIGATMAVLIFINGRFLSKRKHFSFCQAMACVECVFIPLGTALGVFTLIVLSRESVRAKFGVASDTPGTTKI